MWNIHLKLSPKLVFAFQLSDQGNEASDLHTGTHARMHACTHARRHARTTHHARTHARTMHRFALWHTPYIHRYSNNLEAARTRKQRNQNQCQHLRDPGP